MRFSSAGRWAADDTTVVNKGSYLPFLYVTAALEGEASAPAVKIRFWHLRRSQDTATSDRPGDPWVAPNHWGGPHKRSRLLNVMAHNWFKRWLRPWPTHCNWSIWKRVTQPLAEIAALIVLYVELRPRCNESNLSPLVPAGDSVAQGPSQLRETSIMNHGTSSSWSQWNHTFFWEAGRRLTSASRLFPTDSVLSAARRAV